jgi:hypothetical protein
MNDGAVSAMGLPDEYQAIVTKLSGEQQSCHQIR